MLARVYYSVSVQLQYGFYTQRMMAYIILSRWWYRNDMGVPHAYCDKLLVLDICSICS